MTHDRFKVYNKLKDYSCMDGEILLLDGDKFNLSDLVSSVLFCIFI